MISKDISCPMVVYYQSYIHVRKIEIIVKYEPGHEKLVTYQARTIQSETAFIYPHFITKSQYLK